MFTFFTDKHFWAAISIAPVIWLLLALLLEGPMVRQAVFNPIYGVLIYPILEELVFRGWVQEVITNRIKQNLLFQLSYANIITSILFVSLHLFNQPVFWALLVFFPSLIFGYFKDRTNSVLPSIILHVFYNAGFFYFVLL